MSYIPGKSSHKKFGSKYNSGKWFLCKVQYFVWIIILSEAFFMRLKFLSRYLEMLNKMFAVQCLQHLL